MPYHVDPSELLSFIDDELSSEQVNALRDKLADDPAVLRSVEAMRRDRALLRSATELTVPAEVQSGLDELMVRPMLIDTMARDWRRQHGHRDSRRLMLTAAGLLLAAGLGFWLTTERFSGHGAVEDSLMSARGPADGAASDRAGTTTGRAANGVLSPAGEFAGSSSSSGTLAAKGKDAAGPESGASRASDDAGTIVGQGMLASRVALVVRTNDPEQALAILRKVVQEHSNASALVRNLTYEEAMELERMRLAAAHNAGGAPATAADAARTGDASRTQGTLPGMSAKKPSAHEAIRSAADHAPRSGLVEGRAENAAPLDQQLVYSKSGAELTLSIPAAAIDEVLRQLQLEHGLTTSLRRLDPATKSDAAVRNPVNDHASPGSTELRWLMDLRSVQTTGQQAHQSDGPSMILLPVVIESRPAARH